MEFEKKSRKELKESMDLSMKKLMDFMKKSSNLNLMLAPTRELAVQIHEEVSKFDRVTRIWTACVYGGIRREYQSKILAWSYEIVITTPVKLNDFLKAEII